MDIRKVDLLQQLCNYRRCYDYETFLCQCLHVITAQHSSDPVTTSTETYCDMHVAHVHALLEI